MAIETTWRIAQLERQTDTGGVVIAHWRVSAEDGDYTASAYGTAGFTPDPDAAGFVPYADLTEADVLAWVWASVDKEEMEANLAQQIEAQKAPVTASGLPWQ
jgi:hypothetical protein